MEYLKDIKSINIHKYTLTLGYIDRTGNTYIGFKLKEIENGKRKELDINLILNIK